MPAIDPDLELQGVIIAALKADPVVASLVGDRVFDTVTPDADFPYITYGPTSSVEDDADCITGHDLAIQINTWSREVGYPEAKRINDAIRACLHNSETVTLAQNALVYLQHRQTQTQRDPDGITSHGILQFEAFIERRA